MASKAKGGKGPTGIPQYKTDLPPAGGKVDKSGEVLYHLKNVAQAMNQQPGVKALNRMDTIPASSPQDAYKKFVGFMQEYAPGFNINQHRNPDQLDFMTNLKQKGVYDATATMTPQQLFQNELRASPAGQPFRSKPVTSLKVQPWKALIGANPIGTKVTKTKDTTKSVVEDYMKGMAKAGYTPDEAMHAMAANWSPDMKTLPDIKKMASATYKAKLALATKPAPVIDQYVKTIIDPLEASKFEQKVNLYNQYSSYFARKQAGLKGKKLGTNPLTGYSRTYLGVPTGQPITPTMVYNSLMADASNHEKGAFTDISTNLKQQGYYNQVQAFLRNKIGTDPLTGKRTTASLTELFNAKKIDIGDVLQAYIKVAQNLQNTTGGSAGVGNTPGFKQAG